MRAGIEGWKGVGAAVGLPLFTHYLAEALISEGECQEAFDLMEPFFAELERSGEHFQDAVVRYTMGDAVLAGPNSDRDRAEEYYRDAIKIAQTQDAKTWEIRSVSRLAALLNERGKSADAADMLASVCGWFSEQTASSDVLSARALLRELKS